jgi:uncharacterized protein YecT (DUF1311 family)
MSAFLMILVAAASNCGGKLSQTAMTMCQAQVSEQADAEMNRVWKQVYAQMQRSDREEPTTTQSDPGFAPALLASQRAWLTYRDAECQIESYEWRGGSMQPFTYNQCTTALTQERTRQLRAIITWDAR